MGWLIKGVYIVTKLDVYHVTGQCNALILNVIISIMEGVHIEQAAQNLHM